MLRSRLFKSSTPYPLFAPLDASRGSAGSRGPNQDGAAVGVSQVKTRSQGQSGNRPAGLGEEDAHAASLGISYKDFVGQKGGENTPPEAPRRTLSRYRLQRFAADLAPSHGGLRSCFWLLAFGKIEVSLKGQPVGDGTFKKPRFGNLAVCGSHLCPVCGPRLAAARADEVQAVLDWALGAGLHPVFLTLTSANQKSDKLAALADAQRRAMRRWKQHRAYKDCKGDLAGIVSAFETTHGFKNGWHPHMHLLLLVKASSMGRALRLVAGLRAPWKSAAEAEGLKVGRAGFKAVAAATQTGRIAGYLTKWNAATEMARADQKEGRDKGRTPSQLLGAAYTDDTAAGVLWAEYAEAMKGKSVLRFSPGLKAAAGLLDVSDEEAATPDESEALGIIDLIDGGVWNEARANGLDRNDLLAAAKSGRVAVRVYLADLRFAGAGLLDEEG